MKRKSNSADSILVVELGHHYFVIDEVLAIFEVGENVEVVVLVSDVNRFSKMYMNQQRFKTRIFEMKPLASIAVAKLFLHLLFCQQKFSKIYYTTGPEHSRFIVVLLWAITTLRVKKRIVLNVRNVGAYWKVEPNNIGYRCSGLVRRYVARKVRYFTFETEAMRQAVVRIAARNDLQSEVMSVRSSDSPIRCYSERSDSVSQDGGKLLLGVLGQIDELRKDYALLAGALKMMPRSLADRINLEFLTSQEVSFLPEGLIAGEEVAMSLRANGYSESEMWRRAADCAVLVSPLNAAVGYGALKGSGTFGDAIALNKLLILPDWADPLKEFASFCRYYSNIDDLVEILSSIATSPDIARLSSSVFDEYTKQALRVRFNAVHQVSEPPERR